MGRHPHYIFQVRATVTAMPYLKPEETMRQFSKFVLEEVRPRIEDEFVRAQLGSMASTLRFMSGEIEGMDEAVEAQRQTLVVALDGVEAAVKESEQEVLESVEEARGRVDDAADAGTHELEEALLAACEDVLQTIDDELDGDDARNARRPLYDFLDVRIEAQLRMCGRKT